MIEVSWVDIYEDVTGDPDKARLAKRPSLGYFWGRTVFEGIPVLVTTNTLDTELSGQQGYCCYPEACIVAVKVIKRKRRKSRKSSVSAEEK
jgi:hypothetical protein